MTEFESMPVLLYKMKAAELQGESSRKELNNIHQEISKLTVEIKTLGQRLNDSKSTNNHLYDLLHEQKFEWEYLGTKEMMLQQMLPETQKTLENEEVVLEDVQFMVWQERQDFCDVVLEFSNKYGLLYTPKPPQVQVKVEEPAIDPELCAAEGYVTEMETSYQNMELKLIAYETEEEVANQEIRLLKNEASVGKEFVRLQEALRFSQEQSKVIEAECESFQQSVLKNGHQLAGPSKTRPQSLGFKQVAQQSKRASSQSKHSSLRQHQHHSDYEADQSDENHTLEEVYDAARLQGAKVCGHLNLPNSSLFWSGKDIGNMSAEDRQALASTKSACDMADSRREPNPQYEGPSSFRTDFNLNQGDKRSFIPKTPSAISKKLTLKKDRYSLMAKEFGAMLVSPTKPSPRESNEKRSGSATHINKSLTSHVKQGKSTLLINPSSAQHGKSMKREPDLNLPRENPRNAFEPYVT